MKNNFKILGIIALVAVIGFSMIACNNGSTGGGGKTNTGNENPSGNNSTISGTYITQGGLGAITFTGSNFSMKVFGMEAARGTFTVSGNTITCKITWSSPELGSNKPGDTEILTIIDANTLKDEEGNVYTKT
jgi:hypothetical protein